MTPQLKYGLIALFILLDLCVVVYLFSGNPTPPVKQAAAPPPVATPPPAQSPPQPVVYQPPVQPPAPTPQQLQQQREQAAREECNQTEAKYYRILITDAEAKLQDIFTRYNTPGVSTDTKRGLDMQSGNLIQSMRNSRSEWQREKNQCLQVIGWLPKKLVGDTDEHTFFRRDCKTRDGNFAAWFAVLKNFRPSEKDNYLTSRGERPYEQFVAGWQQVERQCAQDVPGWVTPASTKTAYEQQAR